MMRHDCSKGDLGNMGLLSDLNLNINDFQGNPTFLFVPNAKNEIQNVIWKREINVKE